MNLQEDMTALVSQLFRRSFCECLVYGNSTPEVMGVGVMGVGVSEWWGWGGVMCILDSKGVVSRQ